MSQLSFDQIIADSPALSSDVKAVLLENTGMLSDENKRIIADKLLEYEKSVLVGAQSFLAYLDGA
jgi:hypothetical protein